MDFSADKPSDSNRALNTLIYSGNDPETENAVELCLDSCHTKYYEKFACLFLTGKFFSDLLHSNRKIMCIFLQELTLLCSLYSFLYFMFEM